MTMTLKELGAKIFAYYIVSNTKKWVKQPIQTQEYVFRALLKQGSKTAFGSDHRFNFIDSYKTFADHVPVRDYEDLKNYIDRALAGEHDVLWPGKPIYFAKTSGTTSGSKYIPLTKDSMPYHIKAARNAILHYIHECGITSFVNHKMIFLQGSPELENKNGIFFGRLSGIVAHYVPKYLQSNRLPSWETNCIEDWEKKVDKIVEETVDQNMSVISGIPSWVQMYFEKLIQKAGKPVGEIFPHFSLFIHGGVNFEPYYSKFKALIGRPIDSIELFPASEGFFAYQDSQKEKGMLLLLNSGIFYEFIRSDQFFTDTPKRHTIAEVVEGVDYVLIVSTNAGLWAYNTGDTVRFTSLNPYRVIVSGRIKHYISAFGEHVIGKEVDQAMKTAIEATNAAITEFTVAPQITPVSGLPYHEWCIEFEHKPADMEKFSRIIDNAMREQNIYYDDLIKGSVLRPAVVTPIVKNGFQQFMKTQGKLGGQNKLPRLSNNRLIADALAKE